MEQGTCTIHASHCEPQTILDGKDTSWNLKHTCVQLHIIEHLMFEIVDPKLCLMRTCVMEYDVQIPTDVFAKAHARYCHAHAYVKSIDFAVVLGLKYNCWNATANVYEFMIMDAKKFMLARIRYGI